MPSIIIQQAVTNVDILIEPIVNTYTVLISEMQMPGISAYQVAVNNGFVGSEPEWLLTLEGDSFGLNSYETKALLPATGTLNISYKVTNDPTTSNNGYYHWNGSVYVKDASIDTAKITPWSAGAYLLNDQVNHLGKDWVANANTLSTDVPGTSSKWVNRLSGMANGIVASGNVDAVSGDTIFNSVTKKLDNTEWLYTKYLGTGSYSTLNTPVTLSSIGHYVQVDVIIDNVSNLDGYTIFGKNNSYSLIGIYNQGGLYIRLDNGTFVTTNGLNANIISGEKFTLKIEWDGTNINTYKNGILNKSFPTQPMSFDRLANETFKGNLKGVIINSTVLYNIGVPSVSNLTIETNTTNELIDYNLFTNKQVTTILKSDIVNSSKLFYEFQPTGFGGKPKFIVYVKDKQTDFYIGFDVTLDQDFEVSYVNYYRISSANLYKYVNGVMVSQSLKCIEVGESESVYKSVGASDYTGGYHGDETAIQISFYIDGRKYQPNLAQTLIECKSFQYNQISNTHKTDDVSHTIETIHHKETIFGDNGYITKNRYIWQKAVSVDHWYHGICTIAKDSANKGYDDYLEEVDLNLGNDTFKLEKANAREFSGRNETNSLSVQCTSKLIKPVNEDSKCMLRVWDRVNQSKYYRRFTPTISPILNDVWESEMIVKFNKL